LIKEAKRNARIFALNISYAYDMTNNSDYLNDSGISSIISLTDLENLNDDVVDYGYRLFNECIKNINEIDSLIVEKSANWDISRIALIDRIIIRLALTEMLYFEDIPPKVSIVEAVEISKSFSTEDSSRFINGILDSMYNNNIIKKDNV
tara:strand:+ start:2257 stop:2703 length:447 start_codon:yes stop_codon:yes gene_type:complete